MAEFAIDTGRLALRPWRADDAEPFLAMCNDAAVMEFLGPPMTRAQVDEVIERQNAIQRQLGHCFWAVQPHDSADMIGFCGLKPGPAGTPLDGRIEIGWRLAQAHWGKGFAKEAARAALDWGFANLPVRDIWAITVPGNMRSWGLMERLGMERRDDMAFDHPALADNDPLKPHITYVKARPE